MSDIDRVEFEQWYVDHMQQEMGFSSSVEEITAMREEDGAYGKRGYLNGCWHGWQAARTNTIPACDGQHDGGPCRDRECYVKPEAVATVCSDNSLAIVDPDFDLPPETALYTTPPQPQAAAVPDEWREVLQIVVDRSEQWERGEEVPRDHEAWVARAKALLSAQPQSAAVPDGHRITSVEWLKQVHRDLDACQKLIWMALRGECDPAYCEDAQRTLKEIDALLSAQPQTPQEKTLDSDERRVLRDALLKSSTAITQTPGDGWVRCSERLPTEADEDLHYTVWVLFADGDIELMEVEELCNVWDDSDCPIERWQPTGLRKPQPPQEG